MLHLQNQRAHFVHIPKTGGDFVTAFLKNNLPGVVDIDGAKHWPAHFHKLVPRFQFAFVREPVSWFRSWYAYIVYKHLAVDPQYPVFEPGIWHPQRQFEQYDYTTFRSFIVDVYRDQPSYYTRLLEWYLGPPHSAQMGFIGKQENLREDLITVLHKLGVNHLDQKIRHKQPMNTSPSNKIVVDDDIKHLIQENEHSVYQRFGYKKR